MYNVSVVIPAYNAEATIIKCLNSVVNQTIKIHEILVIDDGSTDNTLSIVQNYIINQNLNNIKLFKQPNSGPSSARNLGIEKSTGDLVAFLDSDDLWIPDKVKQQIDVFKRYNETISLVGCRTFHYKGYIDNSEYIVDFKSLLWGNCFSTPTVMVRKELLLKDKFDSGQKYSEDYGLWLRLAKKAKCIMINKQLVNLADKPIFGHSGLSSQLWKMTKGEFENLDVLFKNNSIGWHEYCFFYLFYFIKFLRRKLKSI